MTARYTDKAVTSLADYIRTHIAARLRAIEVEEDLEENSLADPQAVVAARVPSDNRTPLIEVFDEGWEFLKKANQRLLAVDCTVSWSYASDTDLVAGAKTLRRYETALLKLLELGDWRLGGAVVLAIPTDGASGVVRGDNSATRHVFTQGVMVHVHDT